MIPLIDVTRGGYVQREIRVVPTSRRTCSCGEIFRTVGLMLSHQKDCVHFQLHNAARYHIPRRMDVMKLLRMPRFRDKTIEHVVHVVQQFREAEYEGKHVVLVHV